MRSDGLFVTDIENAATAERALARRTTVCLVISVVGEIVSTVLSWRADPDPDSLGEAVFALGAVVPLALWVLGLVATAVFFLQWLRRGYADAKLLEGIAMPFTRGQILWAFFIPILSLFRPLSVVKGLLRVSDPDDVEGARPPPTGTPPAWTLPIPIDIWWLAFLFSSGVSRASAAHPDNRTLDVVSLVLTVVSGGSCLLVVLGIDALRQERLRRLREVAVQRAIDSVAEGRATEDATPAKA